MYLPFKFVAFRVQGAHELFIPISLIQLYEACILVTILQYSHVHIFFYYDKGEGKYTFGWRIYGI